MLSAAAGGWRNSDAIGTQTVRRISEPCPPWHGPPSRQGPALPKAQSDGPFHAHNRCQDECRAFGTYVPRVDPHAGSLDRRNGRARHAGLPGFAPRCYLVGINGQHSDKADETASRRCGKENIVRVRVALIGCGHWGRNIARVLHQLDALAVICDHTQEAVQIADRLGVAVCPDWKEALADPSINAVAIATPAETHAEIAHTALRGGVHVFVEQPLALEIAEAAALKTLAAETGLTLMVGHVLQYHPAFRTMKDMIASQEIGTLRCVYAKRSKSGTVRPDEDGMWCIASDDVSMTLALAGALPSRVWAKADAASANSIAGSMMMTMNFQSGLEAHVHVSWQHPFREQRFIAAGETGVLAFDDTLPTEKKLALFRHGGRWDAGLPIAEKGEGEPVVIPAAEPLAEELRHFIACVRLSATPDTDATEGLGVLKVLDAGQKSMKTGVPYVFQSTGAYQPL